MTEDRESGLFVGEYLIVRGGMSHAHGIIVYATSHISIRPLCSLAYGLLLQLRCLLCPYVN